MVGYRGVIVPQRVYSAQGQPNWIPLPNIKFTVDDALGLRLSDASVLPCTRLHDGQALPTLTTTGVAVTLRILVCIIALLTWPYMHRAHLDFPIVAWVWRVVYDERYPSF